MLAPKERDFIFVRTPQADAFWEGYGLIEIDWTLLSYYLWERVVQDVIEDAQNVCFKNDLSEESRAHVARVFHESLSGGGGISLLPMRRVPACTSDTTRPSRGHTVTNASNLQEKLFFFTSRLENGKALPNRR